MTPLFGAINVDKPKGKTSHDIVQEVRRVLRLRKVGHGGTLDPMATGVLPILVGGATRLMDQVALGKKTYLAEVYFGIKTDTLDAEGTPLEQKEVPPGLTRGDLSSLFPKWTGEVMQTVPKFSAVRKGGKRLYDLARTNQAPIDLPTRKVTIHSIDLQSWDPPKMTIIVDCGKGTYIRQLASDFGDDLGCGAHLSGLRRTRVGPLSIETAVELSRLRQASQRGGISDIVISPQLLLTHLSSVIVTQDEALALSQGKRLSLMEMKRQPPWGPDKETNPLATYLEGGELVAIATLEAGFLKPKKVFWRP